MAAVLCTPVPGAVGRDGVLMTVGVGAGGGGTWTAAATWPGNTGRTVLGRFRPDAVAATDAVG